MSSEVTSSVVDTEVATVPQSTKEFPTALQRDEEQDASLTPKQKDLVAGTWKKVEDGGDLQSVGLLLFTK